MNKLVAVGRARLSFAAMALVGVAFCSGCHAPRPTQAQLAEGLVWVFPGIEGGPWSVRTACRGFRAAGVKSALRLYDWNRWPGIGILSNLTDETGNRKSAAWVAKKIAEYRMAYPDQPIDLVGYSGGGGMAIMVAEALPSYVRLRNVILCHAAVSPGYDLTKVLRRIDGKLVNFYSQLDVVLLQAGTRIFGTMDRVHTGAAGQSGFDEPPNVADVELATHIEQIPWTPAMVKCGHPGEHFGMFTPAWNQKYVAPYLMGKGVATPKEDPRPQGNEGSPTPPSDDNCWM